MARTCGYESSLRKVTYSILNESHGLCLDRKDLVMEQLDACNRLKRYTTDEIDRKTIENEIREPKMTLDLMT